MNIEIEQQDPGKLTRALWAFYVSPSLCSRIEVKLQRYAEQRRLTTRHKWTDVRAWPHRRGDFANGAPKPEAIPDAVLSMLHERIIASIVFVERT